MKQEGEACCPPATECVSQLQPGPGVRCRIAYPNLMALVDRSGLSSKSSKTYSSAPQSTGATVSSAIPTAASVTPMIGSAGGGAIEDTGVDAPGASNRELRGGVIAGVIVGAMLFLLLAGMVTRYFSRRHRRGLEKEAA